MTADLAARARTLTFGSLFAGVGGFDLGLERAGMTPVWQSEIHPYACRVLAKHWPHVPNLGDITRIDWSTVERPDLICGGYPCQPFSFAGNRNGTDDPRHLWPHFAHALRVLRPRYALLENVVGHIDLGLNTVLADLASLGFDAEWSVVSACSVGAPQVRRRLFVLAYPEGEPIGTRLRESIAAEVGRRRPGDGSSPADTWPAEPDVGRVAYGVPARVERLARLGNAVVPPVIEVIGRALLDAARTSDVGGRLAPARTHHTAAPRCAGGALPPHGCHTASTPDGPSGGQLGVGDASVEGVTLDLAQGGRCGVKLGTQGNEVGALALHRVVDDVGGLGGCGVLGSEVALHADDSTTNDGDVSTTNEVHA